MHDSHNESPEPDLTTMTGSRCREQRDGVPRSVAGDTILALGSQPRFALLAPLVQKHRFRLGGFRGVREIARDRH